MLSNPLLSFFLIPFSLYVICTSASVQYPIENQLPLIARVNSPYSWTINDDTFTDAPNITASGLPDWLSYSELTFSGTPSSVDEGSISVTMNPGTDNEDTFSICVTHFPPPTLAIPISQQFIPTNPSLSSVFLTRPNSALATTLPALRIPPQWSFSIGLQGDTYVPGNYNGQNGGLYFYALQNDGTPLPEWITFNADSMTFDGVTLSPTYDPETFTFVLIASDQRGYQAARSPFQLVVASHELSYDGSQPVLPINATVGEPIAFSFRTDDWVFQDVMRDNSTLNSSDISSLSVDTSQVPWLTYDAASLSLSGSAPAQPGLYPLPLHITGYNQTLNVNTTIAVLPSYFTNSTLNPVYAAAGSSVDISLSPYIVEGNQSASYQGHNITLSAVFDPSSASSFLSFSSDDSSGAYALTGSVPAQVDTSHVNVTFEAYDHTTHTSAHTNLLIAFRVPSSTAKQKPSYLAQRRQLILGLTIGFGILGALVFIAGTMALIRKFCAVKDSAIGGSNSTRNPYVMGRDLEGYGWSEKLGSGVDDIVGHPGGGKANMNSVSDNMYVRSVILTQRSSLDSILVSE